MTRSQSAANLYPLTWLMSDGRLFVQAGWQTTMLDYENNVEERLPNITHAQRYVLKLSRRLDRAADSSRASQALPRRRRLRYASYDARQRLRPDSGIRRRHDTRARRRA